MPIRTEISSFDANGNMDATVLPNGITSDYVYDQLNRLTTLTHCIDANNNRGCDPSETVRQKFEYTLRADGKRTKAVETNSSGQVSTFDWVYDQLGRLVGEAYQSGTHPNDNYLARYRFDLASNRTEKAVDHQPTLAAIDAFLANLDSLQPDIVTSYSYDANDRLYREFQDDQTAANPDTTTFYDFGPNSNFGAAAPYAGDGTQQTGKRVFAGNLAVPGGSPMESLTSTYNLQGRMDRSTVSKPGHAPVTTEYAYNSSGVRICEATGGVIRRYLIDASNPTGYAQVLEQRVGSVLERTYTLGHDIVSQTSHAATSLTAYFAYDGHGSTRALLNGSGQILVHPQGNIPQVFTYDAYGNPIGFTTEQALTNHLYSGEWTDAATGWQYLRARYYDPASGRFNRLDPFAGNNAEPLSLHKYAYVHGDPIQGVDPTGMLIGAVGGFAISLARSFTFASMAMTVGLSAGSAGVYQFYFDASPIKGGLVGAQIGASFSWAFSVGGGGPKGWINVGKTALAGFQTALTKTLAKAIDLIMENKLAIWDRPSQIQGFYEGFAAGVWAHTFGSYLEDSNLADDPWKKTFGTSLPFNLLTQAINAFPDWASGEKTAKEVFSDVLYNAIPAWLQSTFLDHAFREIPPGGRAVLKTALVTVYTNAADALIDIFDFGRR